MNGKTSRVWWTGIVVAALLLATPLLGGEHGQDTEAAIAAEMEQWMKYAVPGEHHQHMQKIVGKWTATGKFWMEPGAPPMETTGSSEITPILGGRFFKHDYKGSFMGNEFSGIGIEGYDNMKQKHTGLWIDTMGTLMAIFEGDCEDGGRVTTTRSTYTHPSGEQRRMRGVTTIVDDNTFTYTSFDKGADGEEMKTMELTYKRM